MQLLWVCNQQRRELTALPYSFVKKRPGLIDWVKKESSAAAISNSGNSVVNSASNISNGEQRL
ncbi:MAG: hypothetical protein ACJAXN_000037 [Psychromonas sp.]|jgi:hypothetical protein